MTSENESKHGGGLTPFVDHSASPDNGQFLLQEVPKNGRGRSATVSENLLPESRSSVARSSSAKPHGDPNNLVRNASAAYRSSGSFSRIFMAWWQELTCILLAIAALIAMVVTLRTHEGKPLPEWPYSISVNSVIAFYIIILHACIFFAVTEGLSQMKFSWFQRPRSLKDLHYFDRGSRGPFGALQLLWTMKHRNPVSTTGALIILAVVVIEPVAQLLIRYTGCQIEVPNIKAHIPLKNSFSEIGPHLGAGITQLPYSLQSAINAGLFNPESVNMRFGCETGNCTFNEVYSTLGYCHKCQDLSKDVTVACKNTTFNATEVFGQPEDPDTPEIKMLLCNTTLPENLGGVYNTDFATRTEYLNMRSSSGLGDNYTIRRWAVRDQRFHD
ncbi:MAG: hypothetical protein Q9227_004834 [Pyrenula ochraceoflavens]